TFRDDIQSLGHECVLIAPEYPHPAEGADDATIVRIPSWRVPFDPEDRLLVWPRLMTWAGQLKPGAFDVIHVQTPFTAHYAGVRLAHRIGAPLVETYHTYFEHYLHHYVPALPAALTKTFARRLTVSQCNATAHVISPSQQMADALRAYGVARPITVLPTGLPASAFVKGDRLRFRALHNISYERPVALFVGRIAHEKNIDFLLRMLVELRKIVPDVLMLIAGEGPAERHVKGRVQSLGLGANVQLLGNMDRGQTLRECYRAADVFVFASRTETQGLVLLEAMAQGTPVVSTAVMGTADVLSDMKGATISPEDEAVFARLTADLLSAPDKRAVRSCLAEGDASAWSSRRFAKRLISLYESLRDTPQTHSEAA
ncbi:MAG: glycosyltransferase, partial [Beijerinckiaceae bacterium]|nr:glycosyltransferase [Beijerinckiaceae bacterium]